jgi:hypothetical protein
LGKERGGSVMMKWAEKEGKKIKNNKKIKNKNRKI